MIKSFLRDESGATAIEYGLIGTLLSIAIIVGATSLGSALNAKFDGVATSVDTAVSG